MSESTIHFYLVSGASSECLHEEVCWLAENLYSQQLTAYVYTESSADCETLDNLLWTYKQESFIPHEIMGENAKAPILLGHLASQLIPASDIVVNLSGVIPPFYQQFRHTIELVYLSTTSREAARERYRTYQSQGNQMITYKDGRASFQQQCSNFK